MQTSVSVTDWNQFIIQQVLVFFGILVAWLFAKRTWKSAQFSNQIYTDEILFTARKEVREIGLKMLDVDTKNPTEQGKQKIDYFYTQAKEDLLNAYELSCGLYLSHGVDKDRFRKLRKKEIIALFKKKKDGNFLYPKLHDKPITYTAIEAVYEEFRDKEN